MSENTTNPDVVQGEVIDSTPKPTLRQRAARLIPAPIRNNPKAALAATGLVALIGGVALASRRPQPAEEVETTFDPIEFEIVESTDTLAEEA